MKLRFGTWILNGIGAALVLTALSAPAFADFQPIPTAAPPAVPEIDPGSVTSALALVSGGLLIIAGRKRGR
jgi:hypothetical protein